ncbi:MAG: hypothetical protein HZC28_18700 [Spirochaetes bacterium]|nr:hypothetical protein [Spirochaetota bacterium]
MMRYIIVSVVSGIIFGVLDGLINANPLAQKLYAAYKPIARTAVNMPAGFIIDVVYGFALAWLFLLIYNSLPGQSGLVKGICFAVIVWFFRVVMSAASHWMMFAIPVSAVLYTLAAGICELLILGILYGLTLKPAA